MVLTAMLFSSCAYYNTLYNAEKAFESAQNRPLNQQGRPTSQAMDEYNRVIRKCGVVLTEYKNSRWAPDALFLMGRALYYRGQNQIQALEAFNDLILYYPNSKYVNEAILYTARLNYILNEEEEAFTTLRNFISNPANHRDHAKAMVLIADMYIANRNFAEAQHFLTLLLERFPKSPEYPEAYILLGITYFDNGNYIRSIEVFNEMHDKKINRTYKLDATYYIAYNYFHMSEYELAYQTIRNLQRREFRLDKLAEQSILQARIIAEMDRPQEAIEILELVITNNPRSEASAESAYHIAEIQFRKLHQYEESIENYNRVRRELARSEYADLSVTRSAVASQILQYHRESTSWTAEQLIAEQYKLAEFYLYELALPDSALFIYSQIPLQMYSIEARVDSLWAIVDNYEELKPEYIPLVLSPDYIDTSDENEEESTEPDALDLDDLMATITIYENDFHLYFTQFTPQSYFMRLVVVNQFFDDKEQENYLLNILNTQFPENRYTEAAHEFMNGEPVTFRTKIEKQQLERYDHATSFYLEGNDVYLANLGYIIGLLESIKDTEMNDLKEKILYTLGYIYFFDVNDPDTAQIYLNQLLEISTTSEYAVFANNFYDGEAFLSYDRLPALVELDILIASRMTEEVWVIPLLEPIVQNVSPIIHDIPIDDDPYVTPEPITAREVLLVEVPEIAPITEPRDINTELTPRRPDLLTSGNTDRQNEVTPTLPDVLAKEEIDRHEEIAQTLPDVLDIEEIDRHEEIAQTLPDVLDIEEIDKHEEIALTLPDVLASEEIDKQEEITQVLPEIPVIEERELDIVQLITPSEMQDIVTRWIVQRGESLWRIASYPEIFGTGIKWQDIYDANRDIITDPELIFPDQIFVIPRPASE